MVKANVGQLDGLQTLVQETVKAFGGVDIFIANAASGVLRPAVNSERTWDWTMNINARSLLFGARAVAPFMQAQGWGRIIGITSIGSTRVLPKYAIVGISKAAMGAGWCVTWRWSSRQPASSATPSAPAWWRRRRSISSPAGRVAGTAADEPGALCSLKDGAAGRVPLFGRRPHDHGPGDHH